jgi:hypothetical protein
LKGHHHAPTRHVKDNVHDGTPQATGPDKSAAQVIQEQAGHSWGSTTAIYTSVGSDFKNTVLRRALDRAFAPDQSTNTRW